jgi:uncharacterized surface protein with fasciclin (FAS1) repeats
MLKCIGIVACVLLLATGCDSDQNPQNANNNHTSTDTAQLSVDEKIQAARKQREGQLNMTSAVRYASSSREFSKWGELAMMSKYGKAAHNFGYTLLAPTNQALMAMDQGFLQILGDEENRDLLDQLMGYYLVLEDIDLAGLNKFSEVELANGKKVPVQATEKKIGEISLAPIDFSTNHGHVLQVNSVAHFPNQELEKRYLKKKAK